MEAYWNEKSNFNSEIPKCIKWENARDTFPRFTQKFITENQIHAIHFKKSKKWLHKCYKIGRVKNTTNYLQGWFMSKVGNQRIFFRAILKFSSNGEILGHSCGKSKTRKFRSWRNCCDYDNGSEDGTSCCHVVAAYLWKCPDFVLKRNK